MPTSAWVVFKMALVALEKEQLAKVGQWKGHLISLSAHFEASEALQSPNIHQLKPETFSSFFVLDTQ